MEPDLSLEGKVAIVTGAARGIGEEIARTFAAHGASIVVVDSLEKEGAETVRELGAGATFLACDVSDPDAVCSMVEAVVERHGRLDILVSAAGAGRGAGDLGCVSRRAFCARHRRGRERSLLLREVRGAENDRPGGGVDHHHCCRAGRYSGASCRCGRRCAPDRGHGAGAGRPRPAGERRVCRRILHPRGCRPCRPVSGFRHVLPGQRPHACRRWGRKPLEGRRAGSPSLLTARR
jgi:hypothetical protein